MFSLRGSPEATTENAVIHAMGQLQDMSQIVETGDIAALLNCTKPTARRWLVRMQERGVLLRIKVEYRPKVYRDIWQLVPQRYDSYVAGYYRYAFNWLMMAKGVK